MMTLDDLTLESGWSDGESIVLDEAKHLLSMPQDIPPYPGLYKLTFADGTLYLGETNNLQRRIGEYVVYYTSAAVENEFRINLALHNNRGARVSYFRLDNSTRSERCKVEHRLISEAGKRARNGGTIEDRIAFYASEITRLVKKLQERSVTKDPL